MKYQNLSAPSVALLLAATFAPWPGSAFGPALRRPPQGGPQGSSLRAASGLEEAATVSSPLAEPLPFMPPALDAMGLRAGEGKSIVYGVFTRDTDTSATPPPDERARLRREAAEGLTNIDAAERRRRDRVGTAATYTAAAYVLWASLLADGGGLGGHLLRFLAVVPIFLAVGFKTSAKEGVCNIGQAGLWDVDGGGLCQIEDPALAGAILGKVNRMNVEIAAKVVAPVLLFALLPSYTSHALVSVALAAVILYAVRDRIPVNNY